MKYLKILSAILILILGYFLLYAWGHCQSTGGEPDNGVFENVARDFGRKTFCSKD